MERRPWRPRSDALGWAAPLAVLVGGLAGCTHASPSAHSGPIAIDLAWLEGTWVSEDGPSVTTERWRREGGRWVGSSETRRDGKVVFTESLLVESRGDRIVYVASPSGQATTAFRLVGRERAAATFENLRHDYPTRIRYVRSGDVLTARIEGTREGRAVASEWRFRRAE